MNKRTLIGWLCVGNARQLSTRRPWPHTQAAVGRATPFQRPEASQDAAAPVACVQ